MIQMYLNGVKHTYPIVDIGPVDRNWVFVHYRANSGSTWGSWARWNEIHCPD